MMVLPLHAYQEEPVDRFLERNSLLVAYEMGLGKTPIAIACAEELLGCGDISTCLLVVPAQLRHQWAQALAKFTDMTRTTLRVKNTTITVPSPEQCVIVPPGPAAKRKEALKQGRGAEYVICSYETVLSDTRAIKKLKAGMVVLDEASAIKSFQSQRTQRIKRSLAPEYRLALTGTPVENRADEAYSIMEWVDPDVLGPYDLYEEAFIVRNGNGTIARIKNAKLLHRKLSGAMVRKSRKDPDVAPFLPEEDYDQWYVSLDETTAEMYQQIAEDLLDELYRQRGGGGFDLASYYKGEPNENTPPGRVMARHLAAEMYLDHPRLIELSACRFMEGTGGSKYAAEFYQEWKESPVRLPHPKLDFLMGRLEDILQFPENKVLVFSRHPAMLDLIQEMFAGHDIGVVTYTGQMSAASKTQAIQTFKKDPRCRVFLSSHAGAYGTDLPEANYLINYDLPWSAGKADQINGRHQRASSEFDKVMVRDIICPGTVEERKFLMIEKKRELSAGLVDGKVPRSGRLENDLISLTDWLEDHSA